MEKKTHGGSRPGAGRSKRSESEKCRVRLWYELVADYLVGEFLPGRKLGDVILALGQECGLSRVAISQLGSPEAWRWYQVGERTPRPVAVDSVDLLLRKMNQPQIGWVLTPPGGLRLVPVWLYPTSQAEMDADRVERCSQMEEKFWKRLPGDGSIPLLAAELGVIVWRGGVDEEGGAGKWPPRLLLPDAVAADLAKEKGAPFPHLLSNNPSGGESADAELIKRFQMWSTSAAAAQADGEDMLYRLQCLPGSPYYLGTMLACVGVQGLEEYGRKKLAEEVRGYFGVIFQDIRHT